MKHVILTLSLLAFVGCKDSKSQDTKTESVEHSAAIHNDHEGHDASGVYANAWVNEIQKDILFKEYNEAKYVILEICSQKIDSFFWQFGKLLERCGEVEDFEPLTHSPTLR